MNPENWFVARSGSITAWLAALIFCGVAALAWFGYRAADEWQRSSAQLVDRRTGEVADVVRPVQRLHRLAAQRREQPVPLGCAGVTLTEPSLGIGDRLRGCCHRESV